MPVVQTEVRSYTPLHEAVVFGKVADVQQILSSGAVSVNARTERKETALHYAMCHKKLDCIRPLVKAGADVNKRTSISWATPLIMGVMESSIPVMHEFLKVCREEGVPIKFSKGNIYGETALHFAASHNKEDAVRAILDAGADVNMTDLTGNTPLHMALKEGHANIVQLLRSRNAEDRPVPPRIAPAITIPAYISQGFLNDKTMLNHEHEYGGALFQDCLPVFYAGKKPQEGLCVEISLNFKQPVSGYTFSWLRGMIYYVSENKQTIKAVVKLNCDHDGRIARLAGEWEATLHFIPNITYPWALTDLTQVPADSGHSYAQVLERSKQLDKQRGRKFQFSPATRQAQKQAQRCMVPKGVDTGDHGGCGEEPLIIKEIVVSRATGSVTIKFEGGGPDQQVTGQKAAMIVQNMVRAKQMHPQIETVINYM